MKRIIILSLLLLYTISSYAQQSINYKAIVKDNLGNVVSNEIVIVQLSILKGVTQTKVYQETHAVKTDQNGLLNLKIGNGSVDSGSYAIDWSVDDHYLNVQIDVGNGLVDFGTAQFLAVPYALNAEKANNVTGLEAIDEGNGIGWRLIGRDENNHGNIGENAVDLSYSYDQGTRGATGKSSTAFGHNTTAGAYSSMATGSHTLAWGYISTALGEATIASGYASTAMGSYGEASGGRSTALNYVTTASGFASTATGRVTTASGDNSFSMGLATKAESFNSLAIGRYNLGGGDDRLWIGTDPLFEIGNGTSRTQRNNALTVLKNGRTGIGTNFPITKLQIIDGTDANLTSINSGYFVIGSILSTNLVFDDNEIMARNGLSTSPLYLQHNGGPVYVGGSLVHSSDKRLKKDIEDLTYGLEEIIQLQPKAYNWKNREQNLKSFGLIAQDVQPIIKNIVLEREDEDKMLSVNYTELIPILINAIKEQHEIITMQNAKIDKEKQTNKRQTEVLQSLLKRVETMENRRLD